MINQTTYKCRPAPAPPNWVVDLLAGVLPKNGTPEWDGYFSWYFLGKSTIGLPNPQSKEGVRIVLDARLKTD
jgi:hypothetical protein